MEFNALSIAIPISIFEAMDRGIPCSTVEPPPAYSIAVASVHIIAAENLAGVHSGKIKRSQISVQLMQPNGKIVPDTKHRTNYVLHTVNPQWNSTKTTWTYVVKDMDSILLCKVWAKHLLKKNVLLGVVKIPLCDMPRHAAEEVTVSLQEMKEHQRQHYPVQGTLKLQVQLISKQAQVIRHVVSSVQGYFDLEFQVLADNKGLTVVWYKMEFTVQDPKAAAKIGNQKALESAIEKIVAAAMHDLHEDLLNSLSVANLDKTWLSTLGISVENFKVLMNIVLPPKVTMESVQRMQSCWIINCFSLTGDFAGSVNAFDFYLDSFTDCQFGARTTNGIGEEKSSRNIREDGGIFFDTIPTRTGGPVAATTFNFLIG